MKKNQFLKFHLSLVFSAIILTACPGFVVENLEKKEELGGYQPAYNTNPKNKNYRAKEDIGDDKINVELVSINSQNFPDSLELKVTVSDANGKYVSGLANNYYKYWNKLIDSCSGSQNIKEFTVEEIKNDNSNLLSIAYVIDYSGSMSQQARTAIAHSIPKLLKSSKEDDYLSVIKFQSKGYVAVPLIKSSDYLAKGKILNISSDSTGTGTNIAIGLDSAFAQLDNSPSTHQKTIVLITDGFSRFTEEDISRIQKKITEDNIQAYTISIGEGVNIKSISIGTSGITVTSASTIQTSNSIPRGIDFMSWLARISGGKYYDIMYEYEFPYIFADIYLKLKNYYSIKYKAPDAKSLHKASISLNLNEKYSASNYYDKSIFKPYDPIGESKFLNIEFEIGSANISPSAYFELDNILLYLKTNPDMSIAISGHTDDVGTEESNQILSENRAKSIKMYFVNKGIDSARIEALGFGERAAIVPNDSDENRKKNRRTEFKLRSK